MKIKGNQLVRSDENDIFVSVVRNIVGYDVAVVREGVWHTLWALSQQEAFDFIIEHAY